MTKIKAERLIKLFQHAETKFMDGWDQIEDKTPIKAAYAKGFLEAFQGAIHITKAYATGRVPDGFLNTPMKGEKDDKVH